MSPWGKLKSTEWTFLQSMETKSFNPHPHQTCDCPGGDQCLDPPHVVTPSDNPRSEPHLSGHIFNISADLVNGQL